VQRVDREGDGAEVVAERAIERFRIAASAALPLRADLADELSAEARPAVHALLFATASHTADDPESLEHHETLAMVTLLARRLALLGGTPTAALRLTDTLLESVRAEGWEVPTRLDPALTTVAVEGFVRGREERASTEAARDAVSRIPIVRLAEGCLGVFPRGHYESERLEAAMEELGRRLFREEIRVCLVDLAGVSGLSASAARALLSIDESARTLGVVAIFAGMGEELREAALRGGLVLDHLNLAVDAAEGLRRALSVAGFAVRRVSWLPAPIRDWFAQGR
jgi:anti-anti-sigma regulatory factor